MGNKLHKASEKNANGVEVDFRSQYRLGRKLGEGAFGVVHECRRRDQETGSPFAVKMIDRVEADTGDIEREVRVMGALDHPNVVKCLDIFVEKCFVCIVMPKYSGGDLVDGLQLHLRKYGKIPEAIAANLCGQMFRAVHHIHQKGFIHRDVKGDNLLMDRPDLSEPGVHLVLSDFGTAVPHVHGKVLRQLTGTRVFWSPEFCQRRYSFPADTWACGVVMYGLVDATFPFRDEKQILERQPKIPQRISTACKDLLIRLLDKEPERRISINDVVEHKWLAQAEPAPQAEPVKEEPPAETGKSDPVVGREQVPQAMALRRREMAQCYNPNAASGVIEIKDFTVDGLHAGEQISYKWFTAQESQRLYEVSGVDQSGNKNAKQFNWTPKSLEEHLEKANIKTEGVFGKGKAKTLQELCQEITNGECSLMHDCTGDFSSSKIVRVVEVVLLRIKNGKDSVLIEAKEKYADGREHDTWRLPGGKQRPNENVKATAERIMSSVLKIEKNKVSLNYKEKEILEEKEDSPSYPGVVTVYRKHIVEGKLMTMVMKPDELAAVGGNKMDPFMTKSSKGVEKTWNWLTAANVQKKAIKISGLKASEESSGLVAMNQRIDEEGLIAMLEENKIDIGKFGDDGAKTVYEFAQEIARGESHLQVDESGLVRVVDVVLLKIEDEASGKVLLETGRANERTGAKKTKEQLPGAKSRPNENIYSTAKRISNCLLNIRDELLTFGSHTLIEEDHNSPSYPGIRTTYRKHIISAVIEKQQ